MSDILAQLVRRLAAGRNVKGEIPKEPKLQRYQLYQEGTDDYGQPYPILKDQKGYTPEDAIARGTGAEVVTKHNDPFGGPRYRTVEVLDDIEAAAGPEPLHRGSRPLDEWLEMSGRELESSNRDKQAALKRQLIDKRMAEEAGDPRDLTTEAEAMAREAMVEKALRHRGRKKTGPED
jgi:hypothetical protein